MHNTASSAVFFSEGTACPLAPVPAATQYSFFPSCLMINASSLDVQVLLLQIAKTMRRAALAVLAESAVRVILPAGRRVVLARLRRVCSLSVMWCAWMRLFVIDSRAAHRRRD